MIFFFLRYSISCIYFVCNFFLNTEKLVRNARHNNLISTIIDLDCWWSFVTVRD